jgi:hypothetical protein
MPGMEALPGSEYGTMAILVVNVINRGRRPATITHVSVMLPRGTAPGYLPCVDPRTATYPIELAQNRAHSFVFNQDALTRDYGLTASRFVARVDEAAGRIRWSHGRLARLWKLHRIK